MTLEFHFRNILMMLADFGTREERVFHVTPYVCISTPSDEESIEGFGIGIGWGYWGILLLFGWDIQ